MYKSVVVFILSIATIFPIFGKLDVSAIINNRGYESGSVGVCIKIADSSSSYILHNADLFFNPASVMKLITGTCAFDLLGSNFTFKTTLYTDSLFDRDSGVIYKNLYIRGGGDPGFLAEQLWLFVEHISHYGINEIRGNLILDDSYFDSTRYGPGFGEDNSSRAYEAPIAALSASFNTVAVHIAPSSTIYAPVHITPFPEIDGVKIISTAKTLPAGSKVRLKVITEKIDGRSAIMVYGGIGIDSDPIYKYRKIYNTWENYGWVLQALFKKRGIILKGEVIHGCVENSILKNDTLYTFTSKPLYDFIRPMYKYSSNFTAEMIFKTISAKLDSIGSWSGTTKIIGEWWKNSAICKNSSPKIANGSGMGGDNAVSPKQIVALLEYALNKKEYMSEHITALPIAGIDGTLKSRFVNSPLKGILRAKTGTLNSRGVSNLAGYVFLPDKTIIFAILISDKKNGQYSHWTLQQALIEEYIKKL